MPMDRTIPIRKLTDTPGEDEATPEVEGHVIRSKAVEQPADDQDPESEVEGHIMMRRT